MRKQKIFALLVSLSVFAAGAVLLGFLVFKPETTNGPGANQSIKQSVPLTGEEKKLLKIPPQGAPETEKAAHFALLQRLARTTDFLDLSTCFGNPLAFRVQNGAAFVLKNNDSLPHTLQISPQHIYTVPARDEREIVAQFGFGPGVYGYGCDDSPDARGILFVTDKL